MIYKYLSFTFILYIIVYYYILYIYIKKYYPIALSSTFFKFISISEICFASISRNILYRIFL